MNELNQLAEYIRQLGDILKIIPKVTEMENRVKALEDFKAAAEEEAENERRIKEEVHRNFECFMRRRKEREEEDKRQENILKEQFV